MEKSFNTSKEPLRRRNHCGNGKIVILSFVCLFLSLPSGVKPQQVHPDGRGVCTTVVRRIESFTISYIQSSLVSFKGVCSWLEIQGCDQYKIVFTPAYKKAFRTVYQQVYACCRGYIQKNRKCVPIAPNTRPTKIPRPPNKPLKPSRPRPPKPDPRPPSRPNPKPPSPSGPNPGGGWGDLPIVNNDGQSSNTRPGAGDQANGNGESTSQNTPTQRPAVDPTESAREPSENATGTLRLLMVIGILLSVIGISVACSLCMMCWNHTKRDNRRTAKTYAYVSKGKDDSAVTISTISRGYSVESFRSVSSASEASACDGMTSENPYKVNELDEGDSGIGKGSLCSDESTSLVSDGSGSLEKNEKPPRFGYSKRPGFSLRLAGAGSYGCAYLGAKSKKQDREHLSTTTKEPWNDIRNIGILKEKSSVYHTLEPEIFEEEDSCEDGVSCNNTNDKPKAYAYAKVNLDQTTGMFYGTDPRYGVFPLQPWDRPGSTEYGSLASSTMTLHSNNGYDRLDRNCRQHQQGETSSSKPCRHRDIEQQLFKLKPPPPPVSPKPTKSLILPPHYHPVCPDRLTLPPPDRNTCSFGIHSDSSRTMRESVGNASITSDSTLTPPPSPRHPLLNTNQEYKRLMGGSLGDVSVRSEGCQYSNTKPNYSRFVGGSWNDISTLKNTKPQHTPVIKPPYSTIAKQTVSELTNKLNNVAAPAIFVQDPNMTNCEPPYTTVMRMPSVSDVSSISDGKLTPPPHRHLHNSGHPCNTLGSGSMSDISVTSDDRFVNNSARNTSDFSDIDLNTPRNTKDFSDIELVNLSSESLKMDTRYSFASVSSSTYTFS